ncbi:hypothetical protein D3C73_1409070 [compost metagenome]
MVLAFMRLARKRSRSGLMVWSRLDTAYHDGLLRQAAAVVRSVNRVLAIGCCTANNCIALAWGTSLAKYLRKASCLRLTKPSCSSVPARTGMVGYFADSATKSSPASGARAAT